MIETALGVLLFSSFQNSVFIHDVRSLLNASFILSTVYHALEDILCKLVLSVSWLT